MLKIIFVVVCAEIKIRQKWVVHGKTIKSAAVKRKKKYKQNKWNTKKENNTSTDFRTIYPVVYKCILCIMKTLKAMQNDFKNFSKVEQEEKKLKRTKITLIYF